MDGKLTKMLIVVLVLMIQPGFVADAFCYTKSINTPHRTQQTSYWCGAASAQMILECNTIANTASRRNPTFPTGTIKQIQQDLYNDIQAHNNLSTPAPGWYTDPDGLQWTLDHYDTVQTYVQYTKSDAAWSCKKLAWTIEHYEVPPAILINDGAHWVVVIAMDTSVAPTPAGTYKINSFTVHDAGYWSTALGSNTKIGYNNFTCKYFTDVNSPPSDPWRGLRVSVCDPDPVTQDLIVPPPLTPGPLISSVEALEAAEAAIIEHGLWSEPGFEEALGSAEPLVPVLVHWPSCNVGPCYGVPYAKLAEGETWVVTAVIIVHGASGEFMEASYAADESAPALEHFYQELTYPFIARESSARPGYATPVPSIVTDETVEVIKINFQPPEAVVPYGCLPDYGDPFGDRGNGYSYGWNAPSYETRDRDAHLDQRYDTLNHMQKPSNPHAVWEIALENGIYNVVLVCGDPSYHDQINNVNVNHCMFHRFDPDPWDGVSDSAGSDFDVYQGTVQVTEGRLSIEPDEGAVNAKICYVKIARAPEPVCPTELIGVDIAGCQPAGTVEPVAICWRVTAGGADIWGTADEFYYAYAPDSVFGDFTAVVGWKGRQPMPMAHEWAKAGIMVRENLEPGSPHVMIVGTPGNGVAFQGRDVANGESWHIPVGGGYGPDDTVWLRLDRVGDTFIGSYAIGGETPPEVWTASASHEVVLPPEMLLGLATTSHEQGTSIEVHYTDLCFGPYLGPPVLIDPELPEDPAGGEGYMGIREVIDNEAIGDQDACYNSLFSGAGTIVDYTASVLNIQDSGGNGNYGNDDVFGVVTAGHRDYGAVDDLSLIARGTIRIPAGEGGFWTFGINSDDGCTLQLPGQNFISAVNGEIVNFESGAALRFYGSRGVADTLGVIELLPGDYPFWLTYHEGGVDAAVELFAAKGVHTVFDPEVFRLVGHQSIGTVPIPGFCDEVIMAASLPGAWGQIDSVQDAMDAVAEGEAHGTNSVALVGIVNHSDPDDGAADPDVSGSFGADLVFPNDQPGDDDDFAVMVEGLLDIPAAGTYQIGFNSDDGAGIQIFGHSWKSIVPGSDATAVIAGDTGDWLITDALTGWSWTAGEIEFSAPGCYEFRAIMFERGGGSFFELFGRGISPTSGLPDPTWHLLEVGGPGMYEDPDGLQLVTPPGIESGLVGHWQFDEGEGTMARDSSDYENHMALMGDVHWVESPVGMAGYGLDFDGDGDYLVLRDAQGLDFAPGSFAVSAWINPGQVEGSWRTILEYDRYSFGGSNWFGIWLNREGGFHFRVGLFTLDSEQKIAPHTWHLVTATYDSIQQVMSVYIDGQLDKASIVEAPNTYYNSPTVSKLTIGAYGLEDAEYFDGKIDDARIYKGALSGTDVAELWRAPIPEELPDLVVEEVNMSPEKPALSDVVTIEASIKNTGGAPIEGAEVVFTSGDEWVRRVDIGPIKPGEAKTVSVTEAAATLSKHTVIVKVDPQDAIPEAKEDNNGKMTDKKKATMFVKDLGKYSNKEVFLISDEKWRDVLKLVSVTTWAYPQLKGQVDCYPTLIYHREGNNFDVDAIIRFLQRYGPTHLSVFGDTPKQLDKMLQLLYGTGLQASLPVTKYKIKDYLSFWTSIDRAVISEDDYETGLMASVVASYANAPLVFDGDFDYNLLNNRYFYAIGNISPKTQQEITKRCKQTTGKTYFTLDELRKAYVDMTGTDKLILVNPDDLTIAMSGLFKPDQNPSYPVYSLYSKHSLAAPFLAAAKFEVIISTTANNYLAVDAFVEDSLASLKLPQKLPGPLVYLTIMANPRAIPMARPHKDTRPALWGNRAVFEELDPDPARIDAHKPMKLLLATYDSSTGSVGTQTIAKMVDKDGNLGSPAIYADKIVWEEWCKHYGCVQPWPYCQYSWDIYLYDDVTKTTKRITTDTRHQRHPAIYGDKIVWMDDRNTYKDVEGKIHHHWDIYMYDLSERDPKKKEVRITTDTGDQKEPAIYKDKIVWQDNRHGNWDIYMYDLTQKKVFRITTETHKQMFPDIYGNKIVWQDDRNGNWDIYMTYDYTPKEEKAVTKANGSQLRPSIWGTKIVWEDNRRANWDVYIYDDTGAGTEARLTTGSNNQIRPVIQADTVVWYSDGKTGVSPVHVAPPAGPHGDQWLTYFHDISAGGVAYTHNLLAHERARGSSRQEVDGRYYGSYINYGKQDRAVGRIFGVTVSDVSAYVARDLFFDDIRPQAKDALLIVREDHQPETGRCKCTSHADCDSGGCVSGDCCVDGYCVKGDKSHCNNATDGPTLEYYARKTYWTSAVRAEFTPPHVEHFYAGTATGLNAVDDNTDTIKDLYDDCYLILYADHGGSEGFEGGYDTNWLRKDKVSLQPSTILDLACATGTVLWGYIPPDKLFAMENMRRGAMVYMAAVDNSYWHRMFDDILEGVFIDGKTIGEAYVDARNDDYKDDIGNLVELRRGDPFYALLGDPTFKPRWWPYTGGW